MNRLQHIQVKQKLRAARVRARVSGTPERPRLSVRISNRHIQVQVIDDVNHKTLAHVSTVGQKKVTGTMSERAVWAGTEIARQAKAAKIHTVVFDRGSRAYHGRMQILADTAREKGLEF